MNEGSVSLSRRYVGYVGYERRVQVEKVSIRTNPDGTTITEVLDARPLHHLVRHSPTGFGWGFGGSGPADLARSILADAIGDDPSDLLYLSFKWEVIAGLETNEPFVLTYEEVMDFVVRHGAGVS